MDTSDHVKAAEALWDTLEDKLVIKDALFKGKLTKYAIRYISDRKKVTIEESKNLFYDVCVNMVVVMIQNKQTFRASHVLRNAGINDLHYFYDLYLTSNELEIKQNCYAHLCKHFPNFKDEEVILQANHSCFKLLEANIEKHAKYIDNINRILNCSAITLNNIHKATFPLFMKQPVQWRNDISIDVFFKSKRDPRFIDLLPILDKNCFFTYIMQNELYTFLKRWLNEQYLIRAGIAVSLSNDDPKNFDNALHYLFRKFHIEESMTNEVRRQRDVIKNEFAKLGLFDSRENKNICRKLNRFFTTHSFNENYTSLKSYEITKFILENKLINLLPHEFIDHSYIQTILSKESNLEFSISDELVHLEILGNLFTNEINLVDFVKIMNQTSEYIEKHDKSFNVNQKELCLLNQILDNDLENFKSFASTNSFTQNLLTKLNSKEEELPSVKKLLEENFSIRLEYIRDEFGNVSSDFIPNFDFTELSSLYGEEASLNYIDYLQRYQGNFASYIFILNTIKNSMTLSKHSIQYAIFEVNSLILRNLNDQYMVNNCLTFLEIFSVDTRKIRCLMQLLKLQPNINDEISERSLDLMLQIGSNDEDIKKIESLEVYWNFSKIENPIRSYLTPFINKNDWFRLTIMAEYFDYSLSSFISICQNRLGNKTLCDNLIRAVSYQESTQDDSSHLNLSRRKSIDSNSSTTLELYPNDAFLDSKHDLFAIILKSNTSMDSTDYQFEKFQKFFFDENITSKDLLLQAVRYNWPILAVLAATTKCYRLDYCWMTWMILSINYKFNEFTKFETIEELAENIIEFCIRIGFIKTLDESIAIFYPETPLKIFTGFLKESENGNFKDMEIQLKSFVVQIYNDDFRISILKDKHQLIQFIVKCLIIHLQYNFKFSTQKLEYLSRIHRSEIAEFDERIDFELMRNFCMILSHTNVEIDYEAFYDSKDRIAKEIDYVCDELINNNYFEAAIEVANLMNKSKTDFVFKYWLHMRKTEAQKQTSFDIAKYMKYVDIYGINMEIFIKFLKHVIDEMDECADKYNIMMFILRNINKSSEMILEELEYEIIHLYVRLKTIGVKGIQPLTSLYYENVIKAEKSLIHKSLYELKSIAMIDDTKVNQSLTDESEIRQLDELMFQLLDINDIIQVLRIQALFCHAPEDLKILVYMQSVAEGITSIYDITKQERQTIQTYGKMSNQFTRLALRPLRNNLSNSMLMDSSTFSSDLNESSILEEPSHYKENKETLQALQGLLYKLKHGNKYGQRIVFIYRISLFLQDYSFNDLLKIKSSSEFLRIVASSDCDNKLIVMSDIIEAMQMTREEIAQFISKEIAVCIIKTRFVQFVKDTVSSNSSLNLVTPMISTTSLNNANQITDDIWGFSLSNDLHLILELCKGKTALLGSYLLKFYKILSQSSADLPIKCDSFSEDLKILCEDLNRSLEPNMMSLKKQNFIRVELLVTAHDCFCHECSMEGIGEILRFSKTFINDLAENENFNMIVKLVCGIGRYREMFYCFDILIKNEAFESLLGQINDKQSSGLKNALLQYLKEYHPKNVEYFKMCASHFQMYTELGKMWKSCVIEKIEKLKEGYQIKLIKLEKVSSNQTKQIEIPYLKVSKNCLNLLNDIISEMIHAAEMMSADNKYESAQKLSNYCELIAVQIHLLKMCLEKESKICPFVLFEEPESEIEKPIEIPSLAIAQYMANNELSLPQTIILNKNFEYLIDFSKAFFCNVILADNDQYLNDFFARLELNDTMIEKIIKTAQFETISTKQERILQELCLMISDVGLKFRSASMIGFKSLLQQLLNDDQTYHYLLDSKYGNVDLFHH